jgi:hypothetical protein
VRTCNRLVARLNSAEEWTNRVVPALEGRDLIVDMDARLEKCDEDSRVVSTETGKRERQRARDEASA